MVKDLDGSPKAPPSPRPGLSAIAGDEGARQRNRCAAAECRSDHRGTRRHPAHGRVHRARRRRQPELCHQRGHAGWRPRRRGSTRNGQEPDHRQPDLDARRPRWSGCSSWPRSAPPSTPCSTGSTASASATWSWTCTTPHAVERQLAQNISRTLWPPRPTPTAARMRPPRTPRSPAHDEALRRTGAVTARPARDPWGMKHLRI